MVTILPNSEDYEYTEMDLISFAEFCLERSRLNNGDLRHLVYHADLMNWMEKHKHDLFLKKVRDEKISEILDDKNDNKT